jgi:Na+/H+-dicarboxylate symporter
MSKGKKKIALHWKIIIALILGIIWSMVAGGFFGGMVEGDVANVTVTPMEIEDSTITLLKDHMIQIADFDQAKTSSIMLYDQEGKIVPIMKRDWIDPLDHSKGAFLVCRLGLDKNVTEFQFSYKGSGLNSMTNITADWISPWGTIFIRLLKFIAIPLVLFSIIVGVSSLADMSKLGKLGGKTLGMYLITTVFAVTIGLLLVNTFAPGKGLDKHAMNKYRIDYELWAGENNKEILGDQRLVEDESVQALVAQVRSERQNVPQDVKESVAKFAEKKKKSTGKGPLNALVEVVPENIFVSLGEAAMLQVIFFAIFFGIVMGMLPKERMKGVDSFVQGANDIFVKMVDIIMKYAPFFVFCLMAGLMTKMASSPQEMGGIFILLGKYTLTVLGGLILMVFVIYPVTMLIVAKKKITYTGFFKRISPAQFMAFSTSSSAATLPVTIECVEDRIGVKKKISSFVLPIGATVNMDGTSLYQAVAAIFLAQMHGIDLSIGHQVTIMGMATLASIGSAAVPSAGIVMLMIVLESIGLNPAWIAIILPIDRILDMCRTVVNVTGDATVATIIAKSEGELEVPPLEDLD